MTVPTPTRASGTHFYKTIILEHELYLPSLSQLNDPADGRPKLAPLSEDQTVSFLLAHYVRDHPGLPRQEQERHAEIIRYNVRHHGLEAVQRMFAESLNAELEGYRVYSLSMRYDNLALWAKYAANHSGYCLEFANEGPLFEHAKEVTYGDSIQMDMTNPEHRSGYWFFWKRQEWSNEEEVRLVLPRGQAGNVTIDPRWLTRLVLGWRMADAHRKAIREWAEQREPRLTVVSAFYDEL
jgi:hypothetical protein